MADDTTPETGDEPTAEDANPTGDGLPSTAKKRRPLRWASAGIVGLGLVAAGYIGWTQVKPTIESRKYANVSDEVPTAPKLTSAAGETLLRIDASRSSLTYEIDEKLAGQKASTAVGTTKGIAGDIALADADLSKSRLGQIVVNIEQFRSDNNLRDARIRKDFLKSHDYPLATFDTTELDGLSGKLTDGTSKTFKMVGGLTVKGETVPTTWSVKATYKDGALTATATTKAKLSRFGAGPISIAGLVTTSDEVDLTLELTAVDPTEVEIPATLDSTTEVASTKGAPSFSREIRPVLEKNCALCHNSGQMASDTVRMDTAADAVAISDGIKTVTQSRYMPPFPASTMGVPLDHRAELTDAELDAIARWSDAGAPLDEPATTKVTMTKEAAGLLPRKDVTVRIPDYTGSIDNRNDYRCFVLDPNVTESQFMTGYTFESNNIRQVHHVQLFQISKEQRESARAIEGADGSSGWSCYAGPTLRGERPSRRDAGPTRDAGFAGQSDLVGGWVPGQSPVNITDGSGFLLQPGDAFVLQIHYHFAVDPIPDDSGMSFQFEKNDGSIKKLRVINPLGPVEIPCSPEDVDAPLCDRDAALAENERLYGPSGSGNEAGLLALCGKTHEELAATFDGNVARSDCELTVPQDGKITSVTGHMHTIGKELRLTLDPGTSTEKILLDIPEWSFDWQMNYRLTTPIQVKAGQKIRLDCAWDRSKAPNREPKYIVFAEGTEDEMCFATYGLVVDNQ